MKVLSIVALSGKWHRPVTSFITRMRSFPFKSKHSWHKFFAQTWNNFMHYFANCSLTNIVCVCKGLMGGPARACTVQKHSQSLCNRNGTAHDCVLLK